MLSEQMGIEGHLGVFFDILAAKVAHVRLLIHAQNVEFAVQKTCIKAPLLVQPWILEVAITVLAWSWIENSRTGFTIGLILVFAVANREKVLKNAQLIIDFLKHGSWQLYTSCIDGKVTIVWFNQRPKSLILIGVIKLSSFIHEGHIELVVPVLLLLPLVFFLLCHAFSHCFFRVL